MKEKIKKYWWVPVAALSAGFVIYIAGGVMGYDACRGDMLENREGMLDWAYSQNKAAK